MLAQLAQEPARAALILDVDGTLAPIVPRPEDAEVPPQTRKELVRLARSYALVACLTGRMREDAERVVGVEGIRYVGVHGLELDPQAPEWRGALEEVMREADWPREETEDKGVLVAFHYRRARDQEAARTRLEEVGERARAAGLAPRFGRKVLEVRPPVEADKGTAVRRLLADSRVSRALYAGDDTTDLDAFRGLDEADLKLAVRVAVSSPEAPQELHERADVVVGSPAELLALLRQL
jgi:trehalose 6-phosphate phosphatase